MNVGIDIEEVERFVKYVRDKKFLERIFAKEEISYSIPRKNVAQYLAARFAAKEAVWKALSTRNKKFTIADISVRNTKDGKPQVYIKNKKYKRIDISLSHTDKYVAAVAIAF
ncbi:holo-ACP synthase [Candidatus Endomicrobiellum trichonymphae]|uniref:Holo-[acyl-carrier-protein] synthase n=1 Tax=Endomicrobium trichonymphae TaxID=1408204 RepID=B1GZL4_ENDTX|nr:holo-ACP synthase [Candidatus Endomicrobium trichonymphae]BAG13696.1 holo-[acyl-carrier protein] synthase [Candidatus Endomicrobium trichonymphae]